MRKKLKKQKKRRRVPRLYHGKAEKKTRKKDVERHTNKCKCKCTGNTRPGGQVAMWCKHRNGDAWGKKILGLLNIVLFLVLVWVVFWFIFSVN